MPLVTFQPSNVIVDVPSGTSILDAARSATIAIDAPCGGTGTCGKCLVRILDGAVNKNDAGVLTAESISAGFVLACKATILDGPVTIGVPEQIGRHAAIFDNRDEFAGLLPRELMPLDWQYEPLAVKWCCTVPPPRPEDGLSDFDRLSRRIQKERGLRDTHCPLPVTRRLAGALRQENGTVTVTLVESPHEYRIVDVEPGNCTSRNFGIAVDVGTTTVAVQLVDMTNAEILGTRVDYNKQIPCGLDVISRITYARVPERLAQLQQRVLATINGLVDRLCVEHKVHDNEIVNGVVSGNTTMTHLLLGLPPEQIRLEPYTPTIREAPIYAAGEVGININQQAPVYCSPSIGSYVGGDITAGALCTDLALDKEAVSLFIDIGTNGEMVIGNRDFLMACACSAGPAFEGGGIECGMHASAGAIDKVDVDAESGMPSFVTIAGEPAQGICGTGMISLIASLFATGWIDASGRLTTTRRSAAIEVDGRKARYVLATRKGGAEKPVFVNQTDIDNVVRAKAAIFAAAQLILKKAGLTFGDLDKVFIAGGFGRFLDLDKAILLGLIPDLPRDKFRYIGNSSLMGSYMILVSQEFRNKQIELSRRMTYVELNTEPSYMDAYTAALFLPHTNADMFPSVKQQKAP